MLEKWDDILHLLYDEFRHNYNKDTTYKYKFVSYNKKDLTNLPVNENNEISKVLEAKFFKEIAEYVALKVRPKFWKVFSGVKASLDSGQHAYKVLKHVDRAIALLVSECKVMAPCLTHMCTRTESAEEIEESELFRLNDKLVSMVTSIVFCNMPSYFALAMKRFYTLSITTYLNIKTGPHDELPCQVCLGSNQCRCAWISDKMEAINQALMLLNLFDTFCSNVIMEVTEKQIQKWITTNCMGVFDTHHISSMSIYLESHIIMWLKKQKNFHVNHYFRTLKLYENKLQHYMYRCYTNLLIDQSFDIIIDYPDSSAAIEDLRDCLVKCDLRIRLIKVLQENFKSRLLHPGVNTTDILTAYISTIKALRVLEPSQLILDLVAHPIRTYFKSRDDTIRCIIKSLISETDDNDGELLRELESIARSSQSSSTAVGVSPMTVGVSPTVVGGVSPMVVGGVSPMAVGGMSPAASTSTAEPSATTSSTTPSSAVRPVGGVGVGGAKERPQKSADKRLSEEQSKKWSPNAVHAKLLMQNDPDSNYIRHSNLDIISILVNINSSKKLFMDEYRTLLAERILSKYEFENERETMFIQLLQFLFSERQLMYCDIMLKDIDESRRINQIIKDEAIKLSENTPQKRITRSKKNSPLPASNSTDSLNLKTMILSNEYWPTFKDEHVKLPHAFMSLLNKYEKKYKEIKRSRNLIWVKNYGLVDLEIERNGDIENFQVSPILATIIWLFQNQKTWSLEKLCEKTEMTKVLLNKKINFWIDNNLIRKVVTGGSVMYHLIDEKPKGGQCSGAVIKENTNEIDDDANEAKAAKLMEARSKMAWSFITGMLTNLEVLDINRIFSMLNIFWPSEDPELGETLTMGELKEELDSRIKSSQIVFTAQCYRLNKE